MKREAFEVIDPGLATAFQDGGRWHWRRFGVPVGGYMDDHAAVWANRLLDNDPGSPVIEMLMGGTKLRAVHDVWIAVTGADCLGNVPMWRAVHIVAGTQLNFERGERGLWSYLAVESGIECETLLGSASVYARGSLGKPLRSGDVIFRKAGPPFELPPGVAGRTIGWSDSRDYLHPPALRVWSGPQWEQFTEIDRSRFFEESWLITTRSDRVGYRLSGPPLEWRHPQMTSEPVRLGSIQVPENGLPIVIMRDGPTVGGYPKLGMVDPADLSWLAQCRPGQKIRFQHVSKATDQILRSGL